MIDYHIHTSLCGHAEGKMQQYVEQAAALGLEEIGFSGHFPYPPGYDPPLPDCVIPEEKFGDYLKEARRLREHYAGRVSIRIGAEFDFLGGRYHETTPLEEADRLGLDFCMASVHIIDGLVVDYTPELLVEGLERKGWDIDSLYRNYYRTLARAAGPGFCTTIGHLDLVKKFNSDPRLVPLENHSALVDDLLEIMAGSDTAMEINTAGWDKPCAEQYPSLEIIRRAVDKGVRITAGSDAHSPGQVGRHFGRLKSLLEELGIERLVGFDRLEPVFFKP
ncbi:MAG: histidinol-phosphatase HisJ [Candidatus Glassbacteria bacterium]|nr:histidinol-phosphatase HisJ [Candidatus Glassbacteria bacterium]